MKICEDKIVFVSIASVFPFLAFYERVRTANLRPKVQRSEFSPPHGVDSK